MKESVFINLGASNHSKYERQSEDYYATDPLAVKLLLEVEPQLNNIWECACGEGHLAKVFDSLGILGKATDILSELNIINNIITINNTYILLIKEGNFSINLLRNIFSIIRIIPNNNPHIKKVQLAPCHIPVNNHTIKIFLICLYLLTLLPPRGI